MPTFTCKSIGCCLPKLLDQDFCELCLRREADTPTTSLSEQNPGHYKPLGDMESIDVHAVHHLFCIPDSSGVLQAASTKLLMTGESTHMYRDIKEARDLLTRWMQLNHHLLLLEP